MKRAALLAAFGLALFAAVSSVHAADVVWSGLIMAQNAGNPTTTPAELTPIEETLKEVFGYNQFSVIAQSRKPLKTGEEDWLATSKHFALHVDLKGHTQAGYVVNLKLLKDDNAYFETDAKLSRSSPLVIKGPQVGDGQLLLILVVQ